MSNKSDASTTLHVTGNCDIIIAGNNSVSDIALSNENLTGAYIAQIAWACTPDAHIQLLRGTELVSVYDSCGQHEYAGCAFPLNVNSEKTMSIRFYGTGGFCTLELQKIFSPITSTVPNYNMTIDFINQIYYTE
jgi:hypothetical protein